MTVNKVVSADLDVAYDPALSPPLQKVSALTGDVAYDPALSPPLQRLAALSLDVAYEEGTAPSGVFWTIGQELLLSG